MTLILQLPEKIPFKEIETRETMEVSVGESQDLVERNSRALHP
jgi:hypothetical protein